MNWTESKFTGENPMDLLVSTVRSHKDFCTTLGIFDEYKKAVRKKGHIGAKDESGSREHLLGRYLNSAARTQLAICPCHGDHFEMTQELIAQLLTQKLYVIDIASGHGAGTISIINSICHLKLVEKRFSTDPLDIEIHALDFSETSLGYYEALIEQLRPLHLSAGIAIRVVKHKVDLRNDGEIKSTVEQIKKNIGANPQYLLTCSAISGVTRKEFEKHFANSYNYIATQFRDDNSLFFWVEPRTEKNWIQKIWQGIAVKLGIKMPSEAYKSQNIRFHWADPHTKSVLPTGAEYFLLELAS